MKRRYLLIILMLSFITNAKALAFCDYTEEYKAYLALSEEERKQYIEPIHCKKTYTDSIFDDAARVSDVVTASISDSYYNSVDENYVTPVKNQYSDGTCWAFSAIATVESSLARKNQGIFDISELHLVYSLVGDAYTDEAGKKNKYNTDLVGGKVTYSPSYFFNPQGILLESDLPYPSDNVKRINSSQYPQGKNLISLETYEIDNLTAYNACTTKDISTIKTAILKYGAVQATVYAGSAQFNGNYYLSTKSNSSGVNHAVTIVGWDDNIDKSNFKGAVRNGGFIVKNSWGTDWGDNGYYYVSYDDYFICKIITKYDASTTTYDHSYNTADLVGSDDFMYNPRSFVATKFTTTEPKEILKKVSYPLPTTGKYRVYLSKGNYQDSNTWIKLYESTSRRTLGIDSVHVDEIVSGDYWIIIDYEANQSFSALTTCNSQDDTSRIDYSIGRSFYSIDQQTWTDMGEMGSGVKCEPDIYTYTDDYSFGNSTITKQDLSNYRESVYITINNENNLNVTEYKVLDDNDDDISDQFEIIYDASEKKFTINNINKLFGLYELYIKDSEGNYRIIDFVINESLNILNNSLSVNNEVLMTSVNNDSYTVEDLANDIEVLNSDYKVYDANNRLITSGTITTDCRLVFGNTTYYFAIKGDTSSDGNINSADLMKIVKYLKGTSGMTNSQVKAADVTGDGTINSADLMKIVKYLKGITTL